MFKISWWYNDNTNNNNSLIRFDQLLSILNLLEKQLERQGAKLLGNKFYTVFMGDF